MPIKSIVERAKVLGMVSAKEPNLLKRLNQWVVEDGPYAASCANRTCWFCQGEGRRRMYLIRNQVNGNHLEIGAECVKFFLPAARLQRLADIQKGEAA